MSVRSRNALAAFALVAALLTGCGGTPAPDPSTPTPLSDEEAFAAAEETYRAYVDALNQVDLADPATFEPVYALTTGDANASARASFSQMHADGWAVDGHSKFDTFTPVEVSVDQITVDLCIDVTDVVVTGQDGQSVVPPERRDRQPARVYFSRDGATISRSEAIESSICDS